MFASLIIRFFQSEQCFFLIPNQPKQCFNLFFQRTNGPQKTYLNDIVIDPRLEHLKRVRSSLRSTVAQLHNPCRACAGGRTCQGWAYVGVSSRKRNRDGCVCKPRINCIRSLPRKRSNAFGAKNKLTNNLASKFQLLYSSICFCMLYQLCSKSNDIVFDHPFQNFLIVSQRYGLYIIKVRLFVNLINLMV